MAPTVQSAMSLLPTAEPQHGVHTAAAITAVVIAYQNDAADGADGAVSNVVVADRGAAAQWMRAAAAITAAVIAYQIDAADGADGAVSNVVVADRGAAAQWVRAAAAITAAVIAY